MISRAIAHSAKLSRAACMLRFQSTSASKFQVINPATEEVVTELSEDSLESVKSKYAKARQAQSSWNQVPLEQRKQIISRFNDLLQQERDRLGQILTSETGKPIKFAKGEISATAGRIQFFLNNVEEAMKDDLISGKDEKIAYEPLGVIGNISAWNYPYFVGTNVFIPALLTGNTVLYKPSEFSSLTGLAIAELMHKAGVPEDAFIPVIGRGAVGSHLLNQPINGVFFTGSYATGKKIAAHAAPNMIKVQLELGGKDGTYVCNDVPNVAATAEALADGAMYNAGQSCCSVERIYVHESIYDEFVREFVKTVQSFKVGDPTSQDTYMGPLTRENQIQVLLDQIKQATSNGAKLLCGGKAFKVNGKGYFFEPAVLVDVNNNMSIMRDESFGPVIGIMKVSSDAEGIKLVNDSDYGLTASVYTGDNARGEKIMKQLDAGTVYLNRCDSVSPTIPWTGRRASGIGSTLSMIGIKAFVQPKSYNMNKKFFQ